VLRLTGAIESPAASLPQAARPGGDRVFADAGLALAAIPRPALCLAGKVFQRYRVRGGSRAGVLPDFFSGAHAAVAKVPLLTRDPRR